MSTKIIKAWINGAVQEIEVEDITSPAQPLSVDERVEKLEGKHKVVITDGNLLVGNGTEELEEITPTEVLSHIGGANVATITQAEYEELETSEATNANTLYMITDAEEEDFTQIQSDFAQMDSTQPDYIKNKPIYNIIINQETGKVKQSLDEIVTAAQNGMVLICSGALSLITDNVIENGSYTMIQLTMFALPNTVLPVNIYADGTVEMELSDNMQMKSDRVTSISEESTDSEYPTAKAVYDALQNVDVTNEWEDIQNKPGDIITTIVSEDVINIENLQDVVYEEEVSCYILSTEYGSDEEYENRGNIIGKEVKISIRKPDDSELNIYTTEALPMYEGEESAIIYFNTVQNFEECVANGIPKNDSTIPAFFILFADGIALYATDDLTGYDIKIYVENTGMETIGLPETALGEEFENINGKLSLALGKTITIEKEVNNSYTTTLGTPSSTPPTTPFVIWNNVVKDKQIYDDIQDGTPVKVSYIENDETIEIGTYNLFPNSTLDTQFGMGSNNTGYYGFINAAQSLEEVLTQGVWTRADSTKPTFTLVFAKSNTTGQSWLQIAAPESLTDITFTIEISTTETESRTIKLTNEAINVDEVPTEGSTNFLTSGAIKNALSSVDVELPQNVSYFTNDANYQNWEQVNESINTKANEIEGKIPTVPTNLSSFINDMNYQTSDDINTAINSAKTELNTSISSKAPSSHNHDNLYYSQSTIETKLTNKQDKLNFETEPKDGNTNPITSGGVYNAIVDVIEIAEGKRKSYVFDDVAALDLWLGVSTNIELLQVGDVFLLRSTTEPDYWWDGTTKQILDTNMDLDGYATTEYVDGKFGDVDTAIAHLRTLIGGVSE